MNKLSNKELEKINGGSTTITASFLGAIFSGCKVIYSIGQALGSSIRRIGDKGTCQV